jgi:hypothetical protein
LFLRQAELLYNGGVVFIALLQAALQRICFDGNSSGQLKSIVKTRLRVSVYSLFVMKCLAGTILMRHYFLYAVSVLSFRLYK